MSWDSTWVLIMLASVIVVIVPIRISVIPVCVVISLPERTQETFYSHNDPNNITPYCHSNVRNETSITTKVCGFTVKIHYLEWASVMCCLSLDSCSFRLTWKKVEHVAGRNLACDIQHYNHGWHLVWGVDWLDSDHIGGQRQTTVAHSLWGSHEGRVLRVRWGDGAWGSPLWDVDAAGEHLCHGTASRRL